MILPLRSTVGTATIDTPTTMKIDQKKTVSFARFPGPMVDLVVEGCAKVAIRLP